MAMNALVALSDVEHLVLLQGELPLWIFFHKRDGLLKNFLVLHFVSHVAWLYIVIVCLYVAVCYGMLAIEDDF